MKCMVALSLLAVALVVGGCQTGPVEVSRRPPRPVDRIDAVGLRVSPPMPLNWDEVPGSDGLATKVNLFQMEQPLSMPVLGSLEFLLYEGRATAQALTKQEPYRTWTFEGDELAGHLQRSMFGWGYAMRLGWGDKPPNSSTVTLIARYRRADGTSQASRPIQVAMVAQ